MEVEGGLDFKLRRVLKGHTEDVRAVATAEESSTVWIFTGSRDSTIKAWQDDGMHITEVSTLVRTGFRLYGQTACGVTLAKEGKVAMQVGHADYVVALAAIPSGTSPIVPGVGLVSGSRDKTVNVWDVEEGASVQQLSGHKYQVNAVGILSGGEVVSGGLDGVLKMWKGGKAVATLSMHKAAILCLCVLSSGQILTGSGDMTIKQWSGNEVDRTYEGHSDSVRALCEVPGLGFVSGSHDMTLRAWTLEGNCIATLVGHTALIYACAATSTVLASGSEDNTVRLWDLTGQCKQVISFPGCVWSLSFLPSGDFVAGVSDAKAYVFSGDEIRHAPTAMIQTFSASVAEFQAAAAPEKKGTGGVPEDQIKDEIALLAPGAKDNDTVFVRKNGKVMAYVWSASDMQWSVLGEVTEGPGDNINVAKKVRSRAYLLRFPSSSCPVNKKDCFFYKRENKWFEGREWDWVFDVDVAEGAPPLKLPMNKGDDPYDAAEIFLEKHQLPFSYLEQVVEFIQQNTGANDTTMAAPMDPLTGGGAYVPPPASAPSAAMSGLVDPFTGAGAYVPDDMSMPAQQPASIALPAGLVYAPHSQYQGFEAVPDPGKVATKIRELSGSVLPPNGLSEDELVAGGPIDDILMIATAGSGSLAPVIATLGKLAKWPADQIFPVLDIFRLLVLNSGTARLLSADAGALEPANEGLGGMIARGLTSSVAGSRMVALRLTCNCLMQQNLRTWLLKQGSKLLDLVADCSATDSKPFRVALATTLLNLGVAVYLKDWENASAEDAPMRILSLLQQVLASTPPTEEDAMFRGLLAAATSAASDKEAKQMAVGLGLIETAASVASSGGSLKVVAAASDLKLMLQ